MSMLRHAWQPRLTYEPHPNGTREVRDPILCGYVIDPVPWAPLHCNRPPEEHEWARGWVPGSIEPFPF